MTPSLASFEDGALIELALAGQPGSFDVLMARHMGAVRKRVVSIVPRTTDVDDLLQEVAFKVWRRLSTFRAESSFRTWMTRVAVNEALQFYRRGPLRKLCQPFQDFDDLVSSYESPHQSLAHDEMVQTVRSEVGKLPVKYRQVVILRELQELSERETAQQLQLTVPAIKSRLFRARLMLGASLQLAGLAARFQSSSHKPFKFSAIH
jgi:RNA polymerase sigma-70 factor (ECF subfamily)